LKCSTGACEVSRRLFLNADEPDDLTLGILAEASKLHIDSCVANPRKSLIDNTRRAIMEQAPQGATLSKALQVVTDKLTREGHTAEEIALVVKPRNKLSSAFSISGSKSFPLAIKNSNSSSIRIPGEFKRTRYDASLGNNRFLLKQVELGSKAVWIFATDEMLRALMKAKVWAVDGCFSIPDPFAQLVTIHAKVKPGMYVPAVYGFLPDKQRNSYNALVESVVRNEVVAAYKEEGESIEVTAINSDFELNIINAFHDALAQTTRRKSDEDDNDDENIETNAECCYFHFRKNILDKMKELGLANACYNMPETRVYTFMKALAALAFIPPHRVLVTYMNIKGDKDNFTPRLLPAADQPRIATFIKYFEGNYLGVTAAHSQGNIDVVRRWNCYKREDTTNNHVEAWHSSKKDEFSKVKNIFKFIVACQESASQDIIKLNHILNGNFEPQKTKWQKKRETVMKHVQEQYASAKINEVDVIKAIITVI